MFYSQRKSKFNNKITFVGEERFHSQLEAEHYKQLLYLEKMGYVKDIVRQPPYRVFLHDESMKRHYLCTYKADFKFWDNRTNKERISDSKGLDTAYSKLKRKMVLLQYHIKVEVWKKGIKI